MLNLQQIRVSDQILSAQRDSLIIISGVIRPRSPLRLYVSRMSMKRTVLLEIGQRILPTCSADSALDNASQHTFRNATLATVRQEAPITYRRTYLDPALTIKRQSSAIVLGAAFAPSRHVSRLTSSLIVGSGLAAIVHMLWQFTTQLLRPWPCLESHTVVVCSRLVDAKDI